MKTVEIIAHRGASYDAPENTLAAVCLGWRQADLVEIDIHLTRDGKIVVIHDTNTKRITGVDKSISEQTLAELRQQDAGKWKDARFVGEKIPTLEEVIDVMPAGKRLVIEVKCGPEIIYPLQQTLTHSRKQNDQFVIIAFSQPTLKKLKKAFPTIRMYWLSAFTEDKQTPTVDELIRQAKDAGVEGINIAYNGPIDTTFVLKVKTAGLACYVWTVDSPTDARRLIAAGVNGITTNRPAWLRQQVGL